MSSGARQILNGAVLNSQRCQYEGYAFLSQRSCFYITKVWDLVFLHKPLCILRYVAHVFIGIWLFFSFFLEQLFWGLYFVLVLSVSRAYMVL